MTLLKLWICIAVALTVTAAEWSLQGLGSVRQAHYYYEGTELKGICVVTDEGVVGMIDHKTGNIVWRNYPVGGRKLHRFIAEGRCKTKHLNHISRRHTTGGQLHEGRSVRLRRRKGDQLDRPPQGSAEDALH